MIELERRIIHSPEEEPAADRVYRPRDVYFDLPFSPLEQNHRRALDECLGCMNGWAASSGVDKLRFVAQGRIDRLERKLMWREGNLPWTGWYDGLLK